MNPNLSAFGLLILALFCSACSAGKPSTISQDGCDVALRYAKNFKTMSGLSIAMKHSPDADEMSIPTPESIESFLKERPEFKNDTMLPLLRKLAVIRLAVPEPHFHAVDYRISTFLAPPMLT
jgi:hypothetical protein